MNKLTVTVARRVTTGIDRIDREAFILPETRVRSEAETLALVAVVAEATGHLEDTVIATARQYIADTPHAASDLLAYWIAAHLPATTTNGTR